MKITLRTVELDEIVIGLLEEYGGLSDEILVGQTMQRKLVNLIIDKLNLINEEGYDKHIVIDIEEWLESKKIDWVKLDLKNPLKTTIEKYCINGKTYIYIHGQ